MKIGKYLLKIIYNSENVEKKENNLDSNINILNNTLKYLFIAD